MNTPEYQSPHPPEGDCPHGADTWTLCERCLAEIVDDNAVLGRFDLTDISAGLAVDFLDDGRVVVYMLHAFNLSYGGGGVSYAWVTHEEHLTTQPDVVIAEPSGPVTVAAQEIADFCEIASVLATALLPLLERAIDEADFDAFVDGLVDRLDRQTASAQTRRFVLRVALLLTVASVRREAQAEEL
jgi:hypothetical protein